MVESFWFSCLIINCFFFYIGLKCNFNYFVLHIYIYIYIVTPVLSNNVVNVHTAAMQNGYEVSNG